MISVANLIDRLDVKNRPSILDPRGRIKFDAWISLGELDKFSAMRRYIEEVSRVAGIILFPFLQIIMCREFRRRSQIHSRIWESS